MIAILILCDLDNKKTTDLGLLHSLLHLHWLLRHVWKGNLHHDNDHVVNDHDGDDDVNDEYVNVDDDDDDVDEIVTSIL